jgi:hypothetical protein
MGSTIGGGAFNQATADDAAVFSGYNNRSVADAATIAGGSNNSASGLVSVVSGGRDNAASGPGSSVGGGGGNWAGGASSTVPGGLSNSATGIASFAAGVRAKATNDYSFVWGGSPSVDTVSTNPMSYTARAPGGFRLLTGTNNSSGAFLPANGSSWAALSDSNAKTDVRPVDYRGILAKVAALPVTQWHYKHDPKRSYVGPMAQDFHAAFGLGSSDKTIGTLDSDGVMYAAIQGLVEELKDRDAKISELKAKMEAMEERLNSLPPAR